MWNRNNIFKMLLLIIEIDKIFKFGILNLLHGYFDFKK
jgi:hypothetical protein